jgi:IPT/TIG domain
MPSPLVLPYPWVRIAFLVILALLLAGWGTCNVMVDFNSCQGVQPMAQLTSLSPGAIPGNSESVLLTLNGSGFTSQSQILWDGGALPTVFMDSHQLQTTITQLTFASFGGSSGSSVQISVRTLGSATGCPPSGNSAMIELVIN